MVTIFTIPKPFRGHIGLIQRNAIASWTMLRPRPEVLLFADEEGTAQAARDLGVRHRPQVARNDYGTPLVNDVFAQAQRLAVGDLLCYVHADMILLSDFTALMERAAGLRTPFLLTGRRWEMEWQHPVDFSQAHWEDAIRRAVGETGNHSYWGVDYFVFPRGVFPDLPPLAIGRGWFDGVLIQQARARKVPVIDATSAVMVVHQNHDYSHVTSPGDSVWLSEEARRNRELAGPGPFWLLLDATHALTPTGVRRIWGRRQLFQLEHWARALFVYRTGLLRHRLGLRRSTLRRVRSWLGRLFDRPTAS